jgi:NADH-quinone oxidoreductase subunit I
MAKGMVTVMRHLLKPSVTGGYPWETKELPERSRTSFALPLDESGDPYCKSCLLCERSCPDSAIKIESEKRADGPGRELKRFTIDLGLCMYCGLCVEACTSSGLHHTGDFENTVASRDGTILVLFDATASDTTDGGAE